MKALKVNRKWLVHDFVYHAYVGTDDFNHDVYAEPLTINKCRIELSEGYSRSNEGADRKIKGIIFCYASATYPFLPFKNRSKVEVFDKEYTIKEAVICHEPYRNEIWSYELELE